MNISEIKSRKKAYKYSLNKGVNIEILKLMLEISFLNRTILMQKEKIKVLQGKQNHNHHSFRNLKVFGRAK